MSHEWADATCTAPKTCTKCEETEGEALGHSWAEATCETPKTCSECQETEGEALGHSWVEASCEEAKHCTVCGQTEGEALGHEMSWAYVDLQTMEGTCSVCNATTTEAMDWKLGGRDYVVGFWDGDKGSIDMTLNGDGTGVITERGSEYAVTWSFAYAEQDKQNPDFYQLVYVVGFQGGSYNMYVFVDTTGANSSVIRLYLGNLTLGFKR